mmetsp:Transcript_35940/g.84152  ORF Transcript_35940/g.84152 Transcript_35940/m.84152 type:complete len:1011 (+) Transcript_35940:208-3240(+)|eukprot:CAMPEP_0178381200 /NCGR_PEP_ID=MMETSP0689_2-20121128/5858_1 /TAXON_ID=160604 /ORGANISM="Amphidinium massartii, Strain CS-259" /LENGTH=1010 /DNA_ID=CAMNT_0020001371 /DNA_START=49 /DNA_END=3081 /DNA_ORIENTATION=+
MAPVLGPPVPPGALPQRIAIPGRERGARERFNAAVRSISTDDALLHRGREGDHDDEAEGNAAEAARPHHAGQQPAGGPLNIVVAVRCRALQSQEVREGGHASVKVLDGRIVILEDPQTTAADDYLRLNKSKERRYVFDEAFTEHDGQLYVYERTTKFLIGSVLQGFNATTFAYGATGAGKTYTMLGNPTAPGIMMLTLRDLFTEVDQQRADRRFQVKCSFLEVYNENIRDLLRPDGDYLDIREDPVKGMCVAGISEVGGLESAEEIMSLLHQANKHRTTEATGANVTSSRSHAVLQVIVEQRDRTADVVAQVNVGKLSMIDLAGSERASKTNNNGMRMIEGANINRSLLALGNCITALSSGVAFVPYRDSKMTRLLKDSLGGNCQTVMIANVSPCHLSYEDTHNTLKYASRARNIKTKAVRNVVSVNYHASKYTEIIKELEGEITDLKSKLAAVAEVPGSLNGEGNSDLLETVASARAQGSQWKQELMQNFEERVRLKRRLIDLAHETQGHLVQKSRAQVGISHWETAQMQGRDMEADTSIYDLQEQLKNVNQEVAQTEENTKMLEAMLQENLSTAARLQAELPKRVHNKDLRAFLALIFRINVLEVENMDLQDMNGMSEPILQQKDLEVEALKLQIKMRDSMIEEHNRLLSSEGKPIPAKPEGWQEIGLMPIGQSARQIAAAGPIPPDVQSGGARPPPPPSYRPKPKPGAHLRAKSEGEVVGVHSPSAAASDVVLPTIAPATPAARPDNVMQQEAERWSEPRRRSAEIKQSPPVEAVELPQLDGSRRPSQVTAGGSASATPVYKTSEAADGRERRQFDGRALLLAAAARKSPDRTPPPHDSPDSNATLLPAVEGGPHEQWPSVSPSEPRLQQQAGGSRKTPPGPRRRGRKSRRGAGREEEVAAVRALRDQPVPTTREQPSGAGDLRPRAARLATAAMSIEESGSSSEDGPTPRSPVRTEARSYARDVQHVLARELAAKEAQRERAGAAERRAIIDKLNRRMKPPPSSGA